MNFIESVAAGIGRAATSIFDDVGRFLSDVAQWARATARFIVRTVWNCLVNLMRIAKSALAVAALALFLWYLFGIGTELVSFGGGHSLGWMLIAAGWILRLVGAGGGLVFLVSSCNAVLRASPGDLRASEPIGAYVFVFVADALVILTILMLSVGSPSSFDADVFTWTAEVVRPVDREVANLYTPAEEANAPAFAPSARHVFHASRSPNRSAALESARSSVTKYSDLPSGVNAIAADAASNGVTLPKLIYQPSPEYTDAARQAKLQGDVLLAVDIGVDGHVTNVRVVRGLDVGLDENAVKTVSTWRFDPARRNGGPFAMQAQISVHFRLY